MRATILPKAIILTKARRASEVFVIFYYPPTFISVQL